MSARIIAIEGTRYLLSITRDLTQQRRLEAQLQQAQRLESVGRLAGGVAHDFNNMLSVILGEAAVLAAGLPPDHPAQESVREIVHAGERSRDLTRQLLAFSRKQAISPRVVGLDALLEAARPTLLRLLGEDVALAFEPAVDLGTVRLDPGQFDQVLVNLAANARDAMPRGGRLTLRTAGVTLDAARPPALQALPPGGYALLTVSDDGQGMDAETLAHLFEPFFTTKAAGKGTGLGLATAYGIVRQSGGAILVASAPGQGTTFSIYLPCCGDAADPLPAAAGAGPARGQGHVLLVEDEAPVRRTTRKLLESLGYRVQEAASGEEALARAGQARFDLLISDVMMPGLKGPELAQRLQALQPGLPTLLISGYAASVIGDQGVLEPGLHFLQKPFTLHDLAAKVREALPDVAAPPASG
jgi:nitrogen-specific signal transduction histidine kinase/CheY-like chemotaxis protein